jgi:acetoin utilization deacetylase AcuC-like enzyme
MSNAPDDKFVSIRVHSWLNFRVKIITDEHCAGYSCPGHPERPERITRTVARLRSQKDLSIEWAKPGEISDVQILRAHAPELLARLQVPRDFDADTPYFDNIAGFARTSAAAALDALKAARNGEHVFSLMRPPGHHATRDQAMGFCYLNNIAIAALEATADASPSPPPTEERGGVRRQITSSSIAPARTSLGRVEAVGIGLKRVAVFDFDVHHGNGTEDILLDRPGVAFFSVHQHPCYPDTGTTHAGNNCFNYPVEPGVPRELYRAVLARALDDLKNFRPDLIAVSAGFDAYRRDPLVDGVLETEDFHWLGRALRAMNVPLFSLLEGGYSQDLPELVLAYLKGVENLPA